MLQSWIGWCYQPIITNSFCRTGPRCCWERVELAAGCSACLCCWAGANLLHHVLWPTSFRNSSLVMVVPGYVGCFTALGRPRFSSRVGSLKTVLRSFECSKYPLGSSPRSCSVNVKWLQKLFASSPQRLRSSSRGARHHTFKPPRWLWSFPSYSIYLFCSLLIISGDVRMLKLTSRMKTCWY